MEDNIFKIKVTVSQEFVIKLPYGGLATKEEVLEDFRSYEILEQLFDDNFDLVVEEVTS